jgi:hypothetical protein
MNFRRLLAGAGIVLAIFGFLAFAAIAIGCWKVSAEVSARAETLFGEATAAIDRVQPIAVVIRDSIDKADQELKAVQKPAAPAPLPGNVLSRTLLRSALNESPGRVQTATRAVDALSDLLVIARVALDSAKGLPAGAKVDDTELASLKQKVEAASATLHSADAILNASVPKRDAPIDASDAQTVETALSRGREVAVAVETQLAKTRTNIAEVRDELTFRLRAATWAIFALAVLGAMGQVSLLMCSVRNLRRQR